jgi:hypothetical protein
LGPQGAKKLEKHVDWAWTTLKLYLET